METVREQSEDSSFLERLARGLHQLRTGGIGAEMDFSVSADQREQTLEAAQTTEVPSQKEPEKPVRRPDNAWSGSWD